MAMWAEVGVIKERVVLVARKTQLARAKFFMMTGCGVRGIRESKRKCASGEWVEKLLAYYN